MAKPGDVLEVPSLGVRIEFRRTAEETGGELVEFDLVGRPRGFITLPHVHPGQAERHEVIEGSLRMKTGGLERLLGPGEVVETPAGTPHRHRGGGDGPSRVRVQVRPAAAWEAWLERFAALDRDGQYLPGGWPRAVAGAHLLLDFGDEGHSAVPPLPVQQAAARAVLRAHDYAAQRRR
jgi:quercetin dioxygenase-like cupin family protein